MNAGQLNRLALSRRAAGRRALLLGAASCPWVQASTQQPAPEPAGRVLIVGPGATFNGLQAALAVARDGDRIDLLPGTYPQPATEVAGRLHLRGLGAGAVLQAH
jgi:hypothetical protein